MMSDVSLKVEENPTILWALIMIVPLFLNMAQEEGVTGTLGNGSDEWWLTWTVEIFHVSDRLLPRKGQTKWCFKLCMQS